MIDEIYNLFTISYESLLVLIVTSICCGLIGSILVLRKLSMVSDAISHSVFLGIVLAYMINKDIASPYLIIGAALFGVLTVFTIESIASTGLVKNDDAVGVVFPLFFSIGVIIVTKFMRNVHIDVDCILMGEVILTPLNRMDILGVSIPKTLFQITILLVINLILIIVFFKEIKITTFDSEFAKIAGFSTTVLFYGIMSSVSITSVVAFEAVGAILVVSFLICPGASAYLVTKDLKRMMVMTVFYSIINSLIGFILALYYNVSVSGMTATVAGITFSITLCVNRDGVLTRSIRKFKERRNIKMVSMILHVGNHMNTNQHESELGINNMHIHLSWDKKEIEKISKNLIEKKLLKIDENINAFTLTKEGVEKYDQLKKIYGV